MIKKYLRIIGLLTTVFMGCKKEVERERFATIRVVNVWTAQDAVKINDPVNYATSRFTYALANSATNIEVTSLDGKSVYLSGLFTLKPKIYSMYLSGSTSLPDTIFREEADFPYIQVDRIPAVSDSVTFIRFVNLSSGSAVLKINLLSNQYTPTTPALNNIPSIEPPNALAYRQISPWSKYPARAATRTTYNFEVRNAFTNEVLIANYSLPITPTSGYFKNISLIIKGIPKGTGKDTFGIIQSNYF